MRPEGPSGAFGRGGAVGAMSDDLLGSVAVSISVSELQWTPDIAPAVMDRIARDAIAYPEQFDRRSRPPAPPPPSDRPTASRAVGRLAVMAIVVLIILALVVVLAAASGPLTATDSAHADAFQLTLNLVRESA